MHLKPYYFVMCIYRQLHFKQVNYHFSTKMKTKHLKVTSIIHFDQRYLKKNSTDINPDIVLSKTGNPTLSSLLVASSPSKLKPYLYLMRMDRPIGSWLVFIPCAWSITMATNSGTLPDPKLLFLFGFGSMMMRGAGCIMNDMWDRDFDKMVDRTKGRPIASGQLSRWNALVFMSIPLSISFSILLTFNWITILLGITSLIPCILYPLMKRVTYWPQMFLGITQNWGVLVAASCIFSNIPIQFLCLYSASLFWTIIYDTIYSYQDIDDDIKIGLKSTAIRFGDNTRKWLTGFSMLTGTNLACAGYLADMTWPYYLGTTIFSSHLIYQIFTVDLADRMMCGNMFRSNRDVGLIFWAFIIIAVLFKKDKKNISKDINTSVSNNTSIEL